MTPTHLDRILANLTQPIAAPFVPPPIPKPSRWGLAPGQLLRRLADSTQWAVVACDNQGVTVRPTDGNPFDDIRLTNAAWKEGWAKVPKPRVPRVRKPKLNP